MNSPLLQNVADLLASPATPRDDVWRLVARLEAQLDRCSDTITSRLVALAAVWVLAWGISIGVVKEGQVSSFSIKEVGGLLLVAPVLLALLYHDLMATTTQVSTLEEVLKRCYRHLFPVARQFNELFFTAGPFQAEELTLSQAFPGGRLSTMLAGSSLLIYLLLFVGPLIALGHLSMMAVHVPGTRIYVRVVMIGVAWIVAIRALLVALVAFRSTT